MLIKLSAIRSRWVQPEGKKKGHSLNYTVDVYVNPERVLYVSPVVSDYEPAEKVKGPKPVTEIACGGEEGWYVTESVTSVVSMIERALATGYITVSGTTEPNLGDIRRALYSVNNPTTIDDYERIIHNVERELGDYVEKIQNLGGTSIPQDGANDPVTIWVKNVGGDNGGDSDDHLDSCWVMCAKGDPGAHEAYIQPRRG